MDYQELEAELNKGITNGKKFNVQHYSNNNIVIYKMNSDLIYANIINSGNTLVLNKPKDMKYKEINILTDFVKQDQNTQFDIRENIGIKKEEAKHLITSLKIANNELMFGNYPRNHNQVKINENLISNLKTSFDLFDY